METDTYTVLYHNTYGVFGLTFENFMVIYRHFPEKREKYRWNQVIEENEKHAFKPTEKVYNFPRDDQEINNFMASQGLESFGKDLCLETIPKVCGFRIREYDGMESVHSVIPYQKIIQDLLSYISDKKEDFQFSTEITKELLFGQGISILKKL